MTNNVVAMYLHLSHFRCLSLFIDQFFCFAESSLDPLLSLFISFLLHRLIEKLGNILRLGHLFYLGSIHFFATKRDNMIQKYRDKFWQKYRDKFCLFPQLLLVQESKLHVSLFIYFTHNHMFLCFESAKYKLRPNKCK